MMSGEVKALVTGAGGQDGTYLSRELSAIGWHTVGVVAPGGLAHPNAAELSQLPGVSLLELDLSDTEACKQLIADVRPDTVFHLAGVSSVASSWESPVQTAQINAVASTALMAEALELTNRDRHAVTFVNASSGEIFAGAGTTPQDESTRICPVSPYGTAKAMAHTMGGVLRSRGLKLSNAILFNHESPLRPASFVTRKITSGVAAVVAGKQDKLILGNLEARRDWGWAPDYVDCMLRMAKQDSADDFVVASGVSHSVRDFVAAAFAAAGIDDWHDLVEVDTGLVRPADPVELVGDATKARRQLGWQPTKSFEELVAAMVRFDLELLGAPRPAVGRDQEGPR
ncbi:MAG: GDP-mannose 4,6-dehydratase [Actinomycetota bacterium]|nr:GDP-mannose 4,6-dehydratase [Actinomycetota bacterium]